MSETTKKLKTRFYINENDELYTSYGGKTDPFPVAPSMYKRLAFEACAILSSKGHTHHDIMSGAALPNRMPPKAKPEKVARVKAVKVVLTAEEKAARKAHIKALQKFSTEELANILSSTGA